MAEPEDIQLVPLADDTPTLDDINWDDEKHVLNDFRADIGLPQVVKFDEGETGGNIPPGLKIYCNQPVLFHTHTSKRQARARTIYRDQTGPFYEVGQTLLIPEDFEGKLLTIQNLPYYRLDNVVHSRLITWFSAV